MNDIVINTVLGLWVLIGLGGLLFLGGFIIGWFSKAWKIDAVHAKSEGGNRDGS